MRWFKLNITLKILLMLLAFSLLALLIFASLTLTSMIRLGDYALEANRSLGAQSVNDSTEALKKQAEEQLITLAVNQAAVSNALFERVESEVDTLASYAGNVWIYPENIRPRKTYFQDEPPPDIYAASVMLLSPSSHIDVWFSYRDPTPVALLPMGSGPADVLDDMRLCSYLDNIFIPIYQNDSNLTQIYMGTETGITVLYPWATGIPRTFDPQVREWYIRAKKTGSLGWTNVMVDAIRGNLMVTCSKPVFDERQNMLGVMGADVTIETINLKIINSQVGRKGYAFLLDSMGRVIARPGLQAGDIRWDESYQSENLLQSDNLELVGIVKEMISGNTGISRCRFDDGDKYIAYSPITRTGWSIGIVMPLEEIIAPAMATQSRIDAKTKDFISRTDGQIRDMQLTLVFTSIGIILLVAGAAFLLSRRITRPILALDRGARVIGSGQLDYKLDIKTGDEIQDLADTFNKMARDLKAYIADLQQTTQAKERIESELRVANEIQTSMLPRIFPAFPDYKEFDLYAVMQPAREVGGDFYDFFLVDKSKLCLVIGDVCGKGIPAALFMAISKTLIKTEALQGYTPDEVLARVNNILYPENDTSMFFTGLVAFLDIITGELTIANGGHNLPLLGLRDSSYSMIELPKGVVLGAMPDIKYGTRSLKLGRGDTVFFYTDGVNEAMDSDNQQYGMDRFTGCLNRIRSYEIVDLVHGVKADIEQFVQGTPQSDDITMLAMRYNGL